MADAETIHAATLIRLDVTTNAVAVLLKHIEHLQMLVSDLSPSARAEALELQAETEGDGHFEITTASALELGRAALAVSWGQTSDVPAEIESQRMDRAMAARFLAAVRG